MSRAWLAVLLALLPAAPCAAHYNMLLPSTAWAKKGETVTFTHQWGHPFEHELSDVPALRQLFVLTPDGKRLDLLNTVKAVHVSGADNKPATAHRFQFTPETRGDFTFVLATEPVFLADQRESVQDIVKVVLHVQTQNGWDVVLRDGPQLVPLTRPYGLLPGMAFQAHALPRPRFGRVEVERYNLAPPKSLPADELITFRARTDPNGVLTCTLPEAGWWGVTVVDDAGTRAVDGQTYPLRQRLTLWVHVSETK